MTYQRMRIKGWRSKAAHLMVPTYEGAPFLESFCGTEKLAECWVPAPDDLPVHLTCQAAADAFERGTSRTRHVA